MPQTAQPAAPAPGWLATAGLMAGGAVALLLALELVCRLLPVSTATHTDYRIDPEILTAPAHHRWRAATGWDLRNAQTLQANGLGFPSTHEFEPNPSAVALIGDSFVESSMLAPAQRPGPQLEAALNRRRPVFDMGGPGSALLDYAERIRFAHERLGIRDMVVLMERSDVRQSLCGSGNVHSACLDRQTLAPRQQRLPPPGWLKQVLRQSALAQYVVSQLKLDPQRLLVQMFKRQTPESTTQAPQRAGPGPGPDLTVVDAVAQAFFQRAMPHVGGRLVLLLDCDRAALQRGEQPAPDAERQRFIALARAAGAIVVDSEPLFRDHFAHSRVSLDVGPYDGHLNALGHQLLAQAAAKALLAEPPR